MKFTKGGDFMLEKISRFLIILVFAISGLLIMEVASPF